MSSVEEYWNALPSITRAHLIGILVTTLGANFGISFLNPANIFFSTEALSKLQLWRIPLNFLFMGKLSMGFLFQVLILARFASAYENDPFVTSRTTVIPAEGANMKAVDYLFALTCIASVLMGISATVFPMPFMGASLNFAIVYLWSKKNPNEAVNVWGFRFTGTMLPWVMIAFSLLTGESPIPDLIGLVAAHLYYFMVDFVPQKYGTEYLVTPGVFVSVYAWLSSLGNINEANRTTGFGNNPNPASSNAPRASSGASAGGSRFESSEHHNAPQRSQTVTTGGSTTTATRRHAWGEGRKLGA